jgi:hypothetical protein
MTEDPLAAILDTLLPGSPEGWPSAGALAGKLREEPDAAAIIAALPPDFAMRDVDAREAALRTIETAHPAEFDRLVNATYLAYYTDPGVRQVIERLTGYEARPPQPLGYELEPFDERLLDNQKKRAPFWRKA